MPEPLAVCSSFYFWSSFSAAELMRYRKPVGVGPSSNSCPRWASHLLHFTSVRAIPWLRSVSVSTACLSTGEKKLGHPEPEVNLVSEVNNGWPQQTHL